MFYAEKKDLKVVVYYDGTRASVDAVLGPESEPLNAGGAPYGLEFVEYTDDFTPRGLKRVGSTDGWIPSFRYLVWDLEPGYPANAAPDSYSTPPTVYTAPEFEFYFKRAKRTS